MTLNTMPDYKFLAAVLILGALIAGGIWNNRQAADQSPAHNVNDFAALEKRSMTNPIINPSAKTATVPKLDCTGTAVEKFTCYEKYYQKMVAKSGAEKAMADLKARYDIEQTVKTQCHQLAHVVGRSAADIYPSVAQAYTHGDNTCWSGYYHGVIEAVIKKVGINNINSQVLDGICQELQDKEPYSFDHYNCVHGLGHGTMYITDDELIDSLKMCDQMADSWEKTSCWSGVFMENVIADGKNHVTNYLKPEDPLYPCNGIDDQYRQTCYFMQSSYMLKTVDYSFPKTFALCRQVEQKYQATCFQSLGRDASGSTISDPIKTRDLCLLGQNFLEQSNCVIGAAKDFVSYHHSDKSGYGFCNVLSADLKKICTSTVTEYYKSF